MAHLCGNSCKCKILMAGVNYHFFLWQKGDLHVRTYLSFLHKLQLFSRTRHDDFDESPSLRSTPLNMQLSFLKNGRFPFRKILSIPSIIQYFFQHTRFLRLYNECLTFSIATKCAMAHAHCGILWRKILLAGCNLL